MQLKFFLVTTFLSISLSSFAMQTPQVKLPDAATLTRRLKEMGQEHFMEKTGIVQKLAARTFYPGSVLLIVESSYADYLKLDFAPDQKQQLVAQSPVMKHLILLKILMDSPEAIEYLKSLSND